MCAGLNWPSTGWHCELNNHRGLLFASLLVCSLKHSNQRPKASNLYSRSSRPQASSISSFPTCPKAKTDGAAGPSFRGHLGTREVLSQRIEAFKPDVVASATGLVGAGKSALMLAIQAATSCEVVGKVESRDDSDGVTKVPHALLITSKSGTKVVLMDLPSIANDDVPMANLYGIPERMPAGCKVTMRSCSATRRSRQLASSPP
jgi:hypothetical protein